MNVFHYLCKNLVINKLCLLFYMKKSFFRIPLLVMTAVAAVCNAQVIGPRTLNMQQVVQLAQENSI